MSEEVLDDSTAIETPEQDVQESTSSLSEDASIEEKIEALGAAGDEPAEEEAPVADEPAEDGEEPLVAAEGEKYEPDLKFKVLDEEHEMDEVFKSLPLNKEAEEKLRELYEKSYGLDHVKEDRERFRQEAHTHRDALIDQTEKINTLSSYLDKKDYATFFQSLDIPKQDILRYALEEAQREEWAPEQRQAYEQQLAEKRRAELYEHSYNSNQAQLESLQQTQVVKDYQLELYKPDVQEFQAAFDQRNGKDAFRNEVAELGTYNEKVHGEVLPVSELVGRVMAKFQPFLQATSEAAAPKAVSQTVAPREVPVIPNTGPAGQSPSGKAIKSLEDLEKYADSL